MKNLEIGKIYRLRRDLLATLERTEYVCEFANEGSNNWMMTDGGIWVNPKDFKIKVLEWTQSINTGSLGVIAEAWDYGLNKTTTHISVSMFEYYEEVEESKKDEHKGQIWSEYNQRWIWC